MTEEQKKEEFEELSRFFNKLEGGLPVKSASYGPGRTDYIRAKDFEKVIKEKAKYVCENVNKICDTRIEPEDEEYVQFIFEEFHDRKMFLKALRFEEDSRLKYPKRLKPHEETLQDDGCCGTDHGHSPSKKHGHKANKEDFNKFDDNAFYAVAISDPQAKTRTYFWLVFAVVGVLLACLFPVWPLELKLGVWWVSYILLMIMAFLIIVRLQFYLFFYIFGVDLWIFPNMFDDRVRNLFTFLLAERDRLF